MTILVVGAGIIGCAVAHALASKGAQVQVLDDRDPGMGASQASAGLLAPSFDTRASDLLRLSRASLAMYDSFMSRLRFETGTTVEYARRGMLKIATTEAESDALASAAAQLFEVDIPHTFLLGDDVKRSEPALSDVVLTGLLVPAYGYVSVPALVATLADAAVKRGVSFTRGRVEGLTPGDTGVTATTADGTIQADAVVVTTGSWTSSLLPADALRVVPIRGQLLYLRARPSLLSHVVYSEHCYLVPWQDGTVLAGATVEDVGFDERSTPEGTERLKEAAATLVPELLDAEVEAVRVGLRPRGRDEVPIIGAVPGMPHVFCAIGHYRNGVILAPLTAALVTDLVLGGTPRPELALVRPDRPTLTGGHGA